MKKRRGLALILCLLLFALPALAESSGAPEPAAVPAKEAAQVRAWVNAFFAGQHPVAEDAAVTYGLSQDTEGNICLDKNFYLVALGEDVAWSGDMGVHVSFSEDRRTIIMMIPLKALPEDSDTPAEDVTSLQMQQTLVHALGTGNLSFRAMRTVRTLPITEGDTAGYEIFWSPNGEMTLGSVTLPAGTVVECFLNNAATQVTSVYVYLP